MTHSANTGTKRSWTIRFGMFGCVLLAFGLLLWARLIVVTNHPRSAIAEPPMQHSAVQPSEGNPRPANDQKAQAAKPSTAQVNGESESARDAAKP